jgi:hypothetical protein
MENKEDIFGIDIDSHPVSVSVVAGIKCKVVVGERKLGEGGTGSNWWVQMFQARSTERMGIRTYVKLTVIQNAVVRLKPIKFVGEFQNGGKAREGYSELNP